MKTLLITGGAGFIGSNFIHHLIKNSDYSIINLDALTYAGNLANLKSIEQNPRYSFIHGNLLDRPLLDKIFQKHQPEGVIHFAAESHVDRSILGPEEFLKTNILGTFHLLEASKAFFNELNVEAKKLFRFHHVSTDEVYGTLSASDPAFSETTPYAPNSPYAASKASSDHLVRAYHHTYHLPVVISNCSNNYGPFQFPEKLIPLVLMNALEEKPLPIYGDGQQIRDWLYVEDHCRAILQVFEKGRLGEHYNIGGKSEKPNLEVVQTLCRLLDEVQPRKKGLYADLITFVKDRPGHDRRYAINPEKIEAELKWFPQESFESGLRKTIDWYLAHQDWIQSVRSGEYREWIEKNYLER